MSKEEDHPITGQVSPAGMSTLDNLIERAQQPQKQIFDATDPNRRVIFFALDGTGNNKDDPDKASTNVARVFEMVDGALRANGGANGQAFYFKGPGTQSFGLTRGIDGLTGASGLEIVDAAYLELVKYANKNPDVKLTIAGVGFSRGSAEEFVLYNKIWNEGVPDTSSPKVLLRTDIETGAETWGYSRNLIEPHAADLGLLLSHDRVSTGVMQRPELMQNPPAPGLEIYNLVAGDEHRNKFAADSIVDPDNLLDTRLHQWVIPGAHADGGGGYSDDGISRKTLVFDQALIKNSGIPITDIPEKWQYNGQPLDIHDSFRGMFGPKTGPETGGYATGERLDDNVRTYHSPHVEPDPYDPTDPRSKGAVNGLDLESDQLYDNQQETQRLLNRSAADSADANPPQSAASIAADFNDALIAMMESGTPAAGPRGPVLAATDGGIMTDGGLQSPGSGLPEADAPPAGSASPAVSSSNTALYNTTANSLALGQALQSAFQTLGNGHTGGQGQAGAVIGVIDQGVRLADGLDAKAPGSSAAGATVLGGLAALLNAGEVFSHSGNDGGKAVAALGTANTLSSGQIYNSVGSELPGGLSGSTVGILVNALPALAHGDIKGAAFGAAQAYLTSTLTEALTTAIASSATSATVAIGTTVAAEAASAGVAIGTAEVGAEIGSVVPVVGTIAGYIVGLTITRMPRRDAVNDRRWRITA